MLTIDVRCEEGWLVHEALLPEAIDLRREDLLAWSAALPAGCKFAARAGSAPRLRAETVAGCESAERAVAVEAGFAAAAAHLGLAARSAPPALAHADCPAPDLAAACRGAGWPFEERTTGALAVDLGVPGEYLPALVEVRDAAVVVAAELVRLPGGGACREAVSSLLLGVNDAFRMVRAVLRGPEPIAFLEAWVPAASSDAEICEAVAAVAVAARCCAREVRLMAEEEPLARAFLERGGMFPPA